MKIDKKHCKAGNPDVPPHDCMRNGKVIECDGEHDIVQCRTCGKETVYRCNFDDDFS